MLENLPRKRMFPEMTDAELRAAEDRAYREAARSFADYRKHAEGEGRKGDLAVGNMLARSANDAQMFWVALRDERVRRENGGAEL